MPETDELKNPAIDFAVVIDDLKRRIAALESREKISQEELTAALNDHPDMVSFRAFRDRWQGQP